ncbi:lipid IV(A) 3-deoxy-D-manno-octulosonic acid transferase [Gilvimarinus xylanilyticus]|uniref:3-deoxy-D-manno-octulosonic acid transferase n=1 Tax=Gilvimarinus xylanilyticus TaxID=2944139 RepID=A0A9X2I361_9GAMM|nr:lipid IV(A) 3-deoxy-D-manno-octulosonic acid transferase [Gilvimarinus xylanilyticus]MCP8899480.1 lipid IV(A) 3-deoxy-D-manno-octulosonic acid transferase [Gilvimarinus xylanilyticus]
MRLLYTLIYVLLIPLVLLRQCWRARRDRRHIERLAERFGWVSAPAKQKKRLWLHTVSVGEFLGALPLIHQLLQRDDLELCITSTTITGSERVRNTLGDKVLHSYMPYDLPFAISRFVDRLQPDALVIMETELWPNTLAVVGRKRLPSVLINARLSERSARGYGRFAKLSAAMLSHLSAAAIQQQADADRFTQLGLVPAKALVTGNIKFDIRLTDQLREQSQQLANQWNPSGRRQVWLVASTHNSEDEIILDSLSKLREQGIGADKLLLVLVPRHPERFDRVGELIHSRGFSCVRRSAQQAPCAQTDVVLGDTMGELMLLYGASDIVFMGGTLADVGGHNFIEPAVWAKPLLGGPVLYNFAEVSRLLIEAQALKITPDAEAIAAEVKRLFADDSARVHAGQAALQVAEQNRGALARTVAVIERFI